MMRFRAFFIVLLGCLAAVPAWATMEGISGITQRIVRLTASDGVEIDATMMYPDTGINVGAPVVVMHHGGPSGHAARSIGAYRFAAERLAAEGYTTISPVSRHSSGYYKYPLEDSIKDLEATVDFVTSFGFDRIILVGHSMGSIRITRYQVTHKNPLVKAIIHFAPTADVYDFVGKRPEIAPTIAAAQDALAAGRGGLGLYPDSVDPETSLTPPTILTTARGQFQTPEALLSWWGPGYPTANSDFFPELTVPQLLLAGTEDPPVPPGRMEELKELAVNSPRVDYVWYQGGDHYFTFHQKESGDDVVAWLKDIGLEPGRRVSFDLVDTPLNASFTPDGAQVPYPDIRYVPEGIDRNTSPLVIYMYGIGGQIFEDPLHRLATLMAHRGYEGLAPQLRDSGFRGGIDAVFEKQAEDLKDVIAMHRDGERPVVLVGYREGVLWAMDAVDRHDIPNVAGFIAVSPPPDLPAYAKAALGRERYDDVVARANDIVAANDNTSYIVEKYFRPAPAVAGSTDAFMFYPKAFLDHFGPESKAVFADLARDAKAPVLMVVASGNSMLNESERQSIARLARGANRSLVEIDGVAEHFDTREGDVAEAIAVWLTEIAP